MSIWTQAAAFFLGLVIAFGGIVFIVNSVANRLVTKLKDEFPFLEELQNMQDNDLVEVIVRKTDGKIKTKKT